MHTAIYMHMYSTNGWAHTLQAHAYITCKKRPLHLNTAEIYPYLPYSHAQCTCAGGLLSTCNIQNEFISHTQIQRERGTGGGNGSQVQHYIGFSEDNDEKSGTCILIPISGRRCFLFLLEGSPVNKSPSDFAFLLQTV